MFGLNSKQQLNAWGYVSTRYKRRTFICFWEVASIHTVPNSLMYASAQRSGLKAAESTVQTKILTTSVNARDVLGITGILYPSAPEILSHCDMTGLVTVIHCNTLDAYTVRISCACNLQAMHFVSESCGACDFVLARGLLRIIMCVILLCLIHNLFTIICKCRPNI